MKEVKTRHRLFYPLKLIFLAVLLLAVYVRLRGILLGYFAFTFDPGRDLLAIKQLVVDHKLSLIGPFSGLSGVFYGSWWYWILALPFVLGRGDPRAIAAFIALANLFVPVGLFILGQRVGSLLAGLAIAILASFSPLLIGYSTQIWNPNLVPPLVMLVILLLYGVNKGRTRPSLVWLVLGILLGLTINLQISFGLAWTFSLLPFFLYLLWRRRMKTLQLLVVLIGFVFTFFPLLFFDLRHNFLESRAIASYLTTRPIRSHNYDAFPLQTKFNDRLRLFHMVLSETLGGKEKANIFLGIFLTLFLWQVFGQRQKSEPIKEITIWLGISIVFMFLFFMWYPDTVWNYYLVGLPVVILSIMVLIFARFTQQVRVFQRQDIQIVVATILWVIIFPWYSLPEWMGFRKSWEGDGSVFRNQLAILDYIYQDVGASQPFNVLVYTPPIYDWHYQYLFWWYGQKTYGRLPGSERSGNLYLIMEPNRDAPWLWEGWIKTVVLDPGKVVSRKEFPGGVVVEKRVIVPPT